MLWIVQCPGSRIKPTVPPGSHSARELFTAGKAAVRHLAKVVWKKKKLYFLVFFKTEVSLSS